MKEYQEELQGEYNHHLTGKGKEYSSEHGELFAKKNIGIMEAEYSWTGEERTIYGEIQSYHTFEMALTIYTSRIIQLSSLEDSFYIEGRQSNLNSSREDLYLDLEKAMFELAGNGKGRLKYVLEQSPVLFIKETKSLISERDNRIVIISSTAGAFILLSLLLFVPYIVHIQRNILVVFKQVATLPNEEINEIITLSNLFSADLLAPNAQLKQTFYNENFTTSLESRPEEIYICKRETENENIEEEELLQGEDRKYIYNGGSRKERKIKEKQKIFGRAIRSRRRRYIIRLILIFIFFAVGYALDLYQVFHFAHISDNILDILHDISYRRSTLLNSLSYLNENLILNYTHNTSQSKLLLI